MFFRLIIAISIIIITSPALMLSQISINEIMSTNYSSALDEDNESSDWIELFNASDSSINIKGFRISDKNSFSGAWILPDTTIIAHQGLMMFASGKDRTKSNKYIIEGSGIGINPYTNEDGFRFHYLKIKGDFDIQMRVYSLRNTDKHSTVGLIMRESFSKISKYAGVFCHNELNYPIVFRYKEDEGMLYNISRYPVDYPNGWVRLKREGDTICGFTKNDGGHWEVIDKYYFPVTDSIFAGIAVSSSNKNSLAAAAISDLNFDGNPLNYDSLKVEEIFNILPGRSYYSHEIHTNFRLNSDGENLYLWNAKGSLLDSISYPEQTVDISYGRYPDGNQNKEYFSPSTPGKKNQKGLKGYAEEPIFNIPAGWYNNELLLRFENMDPLLQIRYTTDGTSVTDSSPLYDDYYIVSDTSIAIRAKGFHKNLFPSKEIVNTYFINDSSSLPVVSFAISPKLLWDSVTGIFSINNMWPGPEVEGNFEIFDTLKNRVFESKTGVRIHGGNSRTYPQKSLRLTARGKYDASTFIYPFFGDNYEDEFNEIIFRNSGIDWQDTKLRDAFCSVIAEKLPTQIMGKYRPYISYLNGEYWGLYDLRERLDEFYLSQKFNLPIESINLIDQDEYIISGRIEEFDEMKAMIFNTDLTKPESYKTIDSLIDIKNLIDYLSMEIFCNNMDWPWNNIKVWSSGNYDGKWRWVLHDLDWTFGLLGAQPSYDLMKDALKADTSKFTRLYLKILENQQFKEEFINRFADLMNTVFLGDRLTEILDSLVQGIEAEMPRHIDKWGISLENWNVKISNMRIFARERAKCQREHVKNHFLLDGISKISINSNIRGAGVIKINSIEINDVPWEGYYFKGVPVTVSVTEGTGYEFTGWSSSTFTFPDSCQKIQSVDPEYSATITANFEKIIDSDSNIVINEIMYKAKDTENSDDWIELYNPSSYDVDISNWKITDNENGHIFHIPDGTVVKGLSYQVVTRDTNKFNSVYSDVKPITGNFGFGFGLPDQVKLYNDESELVDSVYYLSSLPWPTDCDGTGKSLELINPILNNVLGENWQSSKELYGTPGRENSVFLSANNKDSDFSYICYPNPFIDKIGIRLVSNDSFITSIEIFNIFGQKTATIVKNINNSGIHEFNWNGKNDSGQEVDNGIYFCVTKTNKSSYVFKIVKFSKNGESK